MILQSLSFEQCGLPNECSLKGIAKQLGITGTHTLIFKSFKNLFSSLKRQHLQGFESVKSLVLSVSSGIDTISLETFSTLRNLEFLNIMSNRLEKIDGDTISHLASLKSLNLARNLLSVLSYYTFRGLKNLKMLDISMNYFTSLPANLFDQNKKLRELYLHNNRNEMSTLPDNFLANMTKLTEVHLNNNGFLFLPKNLFWGSSSLQYIFLNDNSLVTLPENFFRGLNQVRKLSINNNKIKTLPDKIFEDMKELRVLDLSNNLIVKVSRDLLLGLRSLNELNMERNQLNVIDRQSLFPLTKLSIAKFSHNPLTLTYVNGRLSVFYTNQYLEELYLSNCSINNFFNDWSSGNIHLRLLDLSHNSITNVTLSSFILPSIEITINLSYNKIRNIHFDKIEEMVSWRWENRNIAINLEHNPLLCDCPLYDLLRYHERKMSNLVYNYYNIIMGNLTCVQPDGTNEIEISKLKSSTYECLEHEYFKTEKKCQNDCTCSIRPSDNTRILDCSYKNMSEFLIDETRVIFQRDNPIILNLTGNFLTEIPSTEPLYPINVTCLLYTSRCLLELHNNNISRISVYELNYLKSIYWKKFTLSGNPIICDCNNGGLINFVQSHRAYYKDLDNLTCEDTLLPMHQMSINELCSSYLLSTFGLAVLKEFVRFSFNDIIYRSLKNTVS
ncbi:protein toll-like [Polistes fuscatus]|uniref:protein toll-like n=1 Tax=Polistes fuscatus TaxID=30207 RepID=UPI001CA82B14|nr:protein toll-like [Polistes fuscatus]